MAYIYRFIPRSYYGMSEDQILTIAQQVHAMWLNIADLNDQHTRLIIHNARYSLDRYLQTLNAIRARSGDSRWRMEGLSSMIATLQEKAKQDLFQVYVYLVFFDKELDMADERAAVFAAQTGMLMIGSPKDGTTLPQIVKGVYKETPHHIASQNGPYWRFLGITDYQGVHDLGKPILKVGMLPFEVLISFDIKSLASSRLGMTLSLKSNSVQASLVNQKNNIVAQQLSTQFQIINAVRDAVQNKSESVHQIVGAIAIPASTLDELKDRYRQVLSATSGLYVLNDLYGYQRDLLKLFTAAPPFDIKLPEKSMRRSMLTSFLPTIMGNGFPEPGGSKGIWHGNSLLNGHPLLMDGFGKNRNDPNHALIVGSTGSGKTVLLQTLAYRYAQHGVQVIILEPRGHYKRLASLVTDNAYNDMSFGGYSLNLFDPVYSRLDDQVSYVISLLSMLLKKADGFNEAETAVLRQEVTQLYRNYDSILLQNLVYGLRATHWQNHNNELFRKAAATLADLMEIGILNSELEPIFNRPTQGLNMDIKNLSLVVYDFERVSEEFKGLLYFMILARIQNLCVAEKNIRNRLIIVDEYHLMSKIPDLENSIVSMFKTFRTYGVAVWVAEQNMFTFTGFAGKENTAGRYLTGNAAHIIALHHDNLHEARELINQVPELGEDLLSYITGKAQPGVGVIKLRTLVTPFRLELTPLEYRVFTGS